jgi:hypothetical protein
MPPQQTEISLLKKKCLDPDALLPLDEAAAAIDLAGIAGRSLARLARAGRLTVHRIDGKLFTTLRDVTAAVRTELVRRRNEAICANPECGKSLSAPSASPTLLQAGLPRFSASREKGPRANKNRGPLPP